MRPERALESIPDIFHYSLHPYRVRVLGAFIPGVETPGFTILPLQGFNVIKTRIEALSSFQEFTLPACPTVSFGRRQTNFQFRVSNFPAYRQAGNFQFFTRCAFPPERQPDSSERIHPGGQIILAGTIRYGQVGGLVSNNVNIANYPKGVKG